MKKLYFLLLFLLAFQPLLWSQVAINSNNVPNGNLLVRPSSYANPDNKSGVLIPRVESLESTLEKPDGMIVYLANPTPQDMAEPNGFYYWDGLLHKWIPFITRYSSLLAPPLVFYASGTSFMDAPFDRIADLEGKSEDEVYLTDRTANNEDLCQITSDGRLEIKKTGWYYIQLSITLIKNANPCGIRDVLYVELLRKNSLGAYEAVILEDGITPFKAVTSFPGRVVNASGGIIQNQSQTIVSQAPVKLNEGDIISLHCGLDYIDPSGEDANNNATNRTKSGNTIKYTITSDASIAGRYMGSF